MPFQADVEVTPGAGEGPADDPDETVWGHMMAAIDFTLSHRGPHGLPRPGYADWDDTLNVDHGSGQAESVWCAMLFCRATLDLAELCDHLHRPEEAASFRALHARMAAAVEACAWDGGWYARAFDDEGRPIGVAGEERHRINLIPQSWSVIGEVATRERAEMAMRSAHELLDTPHGLSLLWPPYDGADPRVNGTATYPPGAKENGGIFCHAAAWSIVAAAMLGDGDRAHEYYRQLLPLARADVELAAVEPYVYCQNICGPAHPQHGLGRNAWLTGAASWVYVAGTQWILGIRPTYRGLRVAPVLPASWPGYTARRRFREVWYEITVRRQGPGNSVALRVDGRPVDGDVVPLPSPGTDRVVVEVRARRIMGGMGAALRQRPATPWMPWLCFGVAGGVLSPLATILLLVMAVMASRYERAHGAWVAYLTGVALVWVPLAISLRSAFPTAARGPLAVYELIILCAAGLGLLVVGLGITREHLGWWRAMAASRRAR